MKDRTNSPKCRRRARRYQEEPQPPSGCLFRASQNDLTCWHFSVIWILHQIQPGLQERSRGAPNNIWLTDWDRLKGWMISHVATLRNMKRIMHQKRFPRVQEYWYQYHWQSCLCSLWNGSLTNCANRAEKLTLSELCSIFLDAVTRESDVPI